MDYGCDVSNRYTGYLDSSDHGNSLNNSGNRKNKRKIKKKRKPKTKAFNEKHITAADQNTESTDMGDLVKNQQHQQPLQTFSNDIEHDKNDKKVVNDQDMTKNHETESNSTDVPKSFASYYTPTVLSDTSQDEYDDENELDDSRFGMDDVSKDLERKWSVICFEEERSLLERKQNITEKAPEEQVEDLESQLKDDSDAVTKTLEEPDLLFNNQRVYPTVYFYNSNFGNKNCRFVDWHFTSHRVYNSNNSNNSNNIENDEVEKTNIEKKKKRRNSKRKKYNKSIEPEVDDNDQDNNKVEFHSVPSKNYANSYNGSNDRASQHTNESNSTANYREYINSKNRYNQSKHGANFHSERTFTRRRTSDFVRNV